MIRERHCWEPSITFCKLWKCCGDKSRVWKTLLIALECIHFRSERSTRSSNPEKVGNFFERGAMTIKIQTFQSTQLGSLTIITKEKFSQSPQLGTLEWNKVDWIVDWIVISSQTSTLTMVKKNDTTETFVRVCEKKCLKCNDSELFMLKNLGSKICLEMRKTRYTCLKIIRYCNEVFQMT